MPDLRPSPRDAVSKTLNRLTARGPAEVLSLGLERAKGWVASADVLILYVRGPAPLGEELPGLEFREATAADAARYARDIGTDSASSFAARLSDRTRCFLVDDGERLLHASWATTAGAWTRELRTYLVPPEGDAYIYESFTRADARGRGLYPFALRNIVGWAERSGIARLWVGVEEHNPASIRSVTKAGFEEAFRLPFARRWGRLSLGDASGPHAALVPGFLSRKPPL